MKVFDDIPALKRYVSGEKRDGRQVALVPTMGALHPGHGACVEAGRELDNTTLIVSIFVNPAQFEPGEDMDRYPRTLAADLDLCREWGVDAVFTPALEDIYPSRQRTWVTVDELTEPLCGRTRPGHFVGVTTVVAKLFNIVQPDTAIFGQKDAQQALVIREMTVQLDIPVRLRLAAIAREDDGLARSSRNAYLDGDERRRASAINGALVAATERIRDGERDPAVVAAGAIRHMIDGGVDDVEYAELRGADDLCALDTIEGKVILAVAARVGGTRLIDNVVLEVAGDGSVARAMLC